MFIALISGAALCDEVPGTLDELAAAHQDAVLTLKAFRFNSSISCATETVHAISASGTFNSAGWSVYEAAIRINANPTASLDTKYFSNDGFYFRNFSIAHPEYPSPANTIEDWHEAPPEIFRREIPLDPMSISAAFIGNENAVVMPGSRALEDGSKCAVYIAPVSGNVTSPVFTFCVDEETGLIRESEFSAKDISKEADEQNPIPACSAKLTISPLAEPVAISPPEKTAKLYEIAAAKKEEEEKANTKKKKKKFF